MGRGQEGTGSREEGEGERERGRRGKLSPLLPYTLFCFPSRTYFSVPFPSGHKPISRKQSPRRCVVPHREDIFYFQSIESNLPFSSPLSSFPLQQQNVSDIHSGSLRLWSYFLYPHLPHTRGTMGIRILRALPYGSTAHASIKRTKGTWDRIGPHSDLSDTCKIDSILNSILLLLARTTSVREAI